jgi:signal transduction histidine kinase
MRWRIRYQLLVPPLLLLVGVVGVSAWAANAAANRARERIEGRVRAIAQNLEHANHPLTPEILGQIHLYSGADFVLVQRSGERLATFGAAESFAPPDGGVYDDSASLVLGPRVGVGGKGYLCSGLRLLRRREGGTIYILYPEDELHDAVSEARRPVLVLGSSAALASLALAGVLGLSLSWRLRELERRTRLIAAGDFSPMPLPRRDDEIRDLTRSVNEMADKLAKFQETMKKTERLRLLGQVSGGLAHQLRNGVTGAKLAVQLYLREADGRSDVAALDVALRQLTLLETNLKRFLDLGRHDLTHRETCSLTALVGEAVELLRPQCKHAGIDLRWRAPPEPLTVSGDAGQLQQLILNLLGNAVDAAGPGGWVSAELRIADCGLRIEKADIGRVILEVCDSGAGVSPEVAERLFEPFVTGKPEGVGLGLAVARQVAEAHGGRIQWERRNDCTCFRVEMPLSGAAAQVTAVRERVGIQTDAAFGPN